MKKSEIILLVLVLLTGFILIYSPHIYYIYPLHIDEWHHISQALKISDHEYKLNFKSFEIGFQVFLSLVSYIFDLVLLYRFLPGLWGVFTGIVLFFVIYKKTDKNYLIALFSLIFFFSIKSNVNILGLWFFTPLTFSIPFIFLYIYFFTEGLEKNNRKYLIISFFIMIFLIFSYALAILYSIPILILFCISNYKKTIENYKILSIFLLIPIIGFFFYIKTLNLGFGEGLIHLIGELTFKKGWGVLELNNSFFEIYSPIGYLFAVIGLLYLIHSQYKISHENRKYLFELLLPLYLIISIFYFRIFEVSYLSPYQRNFYFFVLSLPFLSAFGLYFSLESIKTLFSKGSRLKKATINRILILLFIVLIILIFIQYYNLPGRIKLYKLINESDHEAISFLKELDKGKVLSTPQISMAIYPISRQNPVTGLYFYSNQSRNNANKFFLNATNCSEKDKVLRSLNVTYNIENRIELFLCKVI